MNPNQTNELNGATTKVAAQPDQPAAVTAASTPNRKRRNVAAARDVDAVERDSTTEASVQGVAEQTGTSKGGRISKATVASDQPLARGAGSRHTSASATKVASSGKARGRDKQSPATFRKSVAARGDGASGASGAGGDGSKTELVLKKLRLAKGASIAQLSEATGWQAHSVRGFLSAVVRKKLGLELTSDIGKDGIRRYRIADGEAS